MKHLRFFLLVGLLAALSTTPLHSAEQGVGIVSLVHVGVGVSDLQRALHFYTDQLGLKEAFRLNKADGSPLLIYLHVEDSNTFVELFPGGKDKSAPGQPLIYHMGFMVKDLQTTLHALKDRGYPLPADAFEKASEIVGDGTMYYFVHDPDGNRVELSQLGPQALQLKAAPGLLQLTSSTGSNSGGAAIPTTVTVKNDSPLIPFKSGDLRILLKGKTGQLNSFMLGTLDMPPGQALGPETHPQEELIQIFTLGHGELILDGKTTELQPGTVMFVEPKHTQKIVNKSQAPLSYYWFKWTAK
jgi:catechol 2,3-dioxygenase-like lactoylglutathione lyase family enzyme